MSEVVTTDRTFSRRDYFAALGAAGAALGVYLLMLAPTVTGEDSGELIAAAYTLGIPHPPGYPTWTVLAHLFTWLPWGTVAWRVNLCSAFVAATTVGLLVLLIRRLGMGLVAAVGGALTLAFSREFWEQAVIAEVYMLNAFFLTLLLLLLFAWRDRRSDRLLLIFAVVYGLSLGNHNTMHLCAPFFVVFVLAVERPAWRRWAFHILLAGVTFGTAFVVYFYLPLRSAADPAVDWGNPETLQNWWAVVTREQYEFMLWQYPRSWERFLEQAAMMLELYQEQFGSPFVFVVVGWVLLLWKLRWLGLWLLLLGLSIVVAFTVIQNPSQEIEWRWVMSVFGIPLYLLSAVALAALLNIFRFTSNWTATTAARTSWSKPTVSGNIFAGIIAVVVCLTSFIAYSHLDKSDYTIVSDYGRNVLEELDPEAIYVADSDHAAFSTLYLQVVEGVRPDVSLARKYGYLDLSLAPELVKAYGEFPKRRHDAEIIAHLLTNQERPVYLQSRMKLPLPGVRLVQQGLVYRALRPGEQAPQKDWWKDYQWSMNSRARGDDFTARLIAYEINFKKAEEAFGAGSFEDGRVLLEMALTDYGRDYTALNNAGVLCAEHELYQEARTYFEEALALNPEEGAAQRNLNQLGQRGLPS